MTLALPPSRPDRRRFVRQAGTLTAATLAAPGLLRAATNEIVIGCAGSHASWMEKLVAPHMKAKIGASILFEGTKSSVNLEKMASNKAKPYLSVVQMDDPVMIQAVEQDLLAPMTTAAVPNLAKLRKGAVHMDGMWANYVQPWAGIAYNSKALKGVPSWAGLWEPAAKGKIIIPSLQNTEGMWTLFMAAHLGTGKPLAKAQYEMDAAFDKLKGLKPQGAERLRGDVAGLQPARAGRDHDARPATSAATRCRARPKARRSTWRRRRKASSRCPRASVSSRAARTRTWPRPTPTRCWAPSCRPSWPSSRPRCRPTPRCPPMASTPKGVEIFSPDWAFVAKNRKEWITRFDKLMAA